MASLTKMKNGGTVTTNILVKICKTMDCTLDDIMDIYPKDE